MAVEPGRSPSADDRARAIVAELWENFRTLNHERVRAVEEVAVALLEGRLDAEVRAAGHGAAHKLAGSLGSFGLMEGTRIAREVETLLGASAPLGQEEALALSRLAVALRREVQRAASAQAMTSATSAGEAVSVPAAPEGPRRATPGRVLLASLDPELSERLRVAASGRGLAVDVVTPDEAATRTDAERPELVVIDVRSPAEAATVAPMVEALARPPRTLPVAVLTATGTFAERLEAARRGAIAFLPRALGADAVAVELERIVTRERRRRVRILAVDDDPVVLATLEESLERWGFDVVGLPDPMEFWARLEETRPDAVILDLDMPGASGLELCRVLRSDVRWAGLPVLFLTAATDPDSVRSVYAAGADDYVAKPVIEEVIVGRIRNRMERVELARRLAETDPSTGLANRVASERAIGALLRVAEARERPVAVAAVDVDGLLEVNARHGHGAGDELLRRLARLLRGAFTGDDVASRWGGDEFVVAAYGADASEMVTRMDDVARAFAAERVPGRAGQAAATICAGVAAYPADGETLMAVLRAASSAGGRAKAAGPGSVEASVGTHIRARAERLDVLVVEDDHTIQGLLLHALATRGYQARAFDDGEEAVAALTGPEPRIRASVVLLDVELPGMDGLSVLRRLALDGVLAQSRVVMLTGRSGEEEVLEALSTGAFDHVAKPFSVPILLERLRRALET